MSTVSLSVLANMHCVRLHSIWFLLRTFLIRSFAFYIYCVFFRKMILSRGHIFMMCDCVNLCLLCLTLWGSMSCNPICPLGFEIDWTDLNSSPDRSSSLHLWCWRRSGFSGLVWVPWSFGASWCPETVSAPCLAAAWMAACCLSQSLTQSRNSPGCPEIPSCCSSLLVLEMRGELT